MSPDGSVGLIAYSHSTDDEVDEVIRGEVSRAEAQGYELEWKVYGHDAPASLEARLLAAGFEPEPVESLMVLPANEETLAAFHAPPYEVRRVHDAAGLEDVAAISREIGRSNVEAEQDRFARILRDTPDQMRVYVAYDGGEPVACGRIHFSPGSEFAELCGGRTRTTHQRQGLYTSLVAARLREIIERGRTYALVDALPTSEPILLKRGFQRLTSTRPFIYHPGSGTAAPADDGSPAG
jgi:hypothetical protein